MKFENGVPIPTHEFDDLVDSITIKPLDVVESTLYRHWYRNEKQKCTKRKYLILALPDKDRIWDESDLCFYAIDLDCNEPSESRVWHEHLDIREVKKIDKSELSEEQKKNLENLLAYLPTDEYMKHLFEEK